jgi:hypothetical protein
MQISNITKAIVKVMAGVSFVQKAGKNEFHGYKYATEGDALNALRPHLIANELVIISDVVEHTSPDEFGNTTVKVQYRILHSSGEEIVCHFVGCGNDRSSKGVIGDKGIYKALTGANKYFLLKTFQLETGDDPERDDKTQEDRTFEPQKQQVKPQVQPKQEAPKVEAPKVDVDSFIAQVQEELSHCQGKEEAKQVWRRYTKEIGEIKIHFADRENDVMSAFINATKHLK